MDLSQKKEILIAMGDHLDGIDNVEERNEAGFNRVDKDRWQMVRGDCRQMAWVLRKYERQLVVAFGQEQYDAVFAEDLVAERRPEAMVCVTVENSLVLFRLRGKTQLFDQFREVQARYGLTYKAQYGACAVAISDMPHFDFQGFKNALQEIGIGLEDLPQLPSVNPIDDACAKLDLKIAKDLFVLRYIPDRQVFSFRFSFSRTLNDLFSNKTGQLSGIMECITSDWSRETKSIELAREAVEKARALVPDWNFVVEDLTALEKENAAKLEAMRQPIPEVEAKLDPSFKLFPFQNEFVRFLSATDGNALIGAEMGLGKTLISLAWCAAHNKRALVVCPKVVRRTWVEEAKRFFPSHFNHALELRADHLRKNGMPDLTQVAIATINFASFSKFLPAIEKGSFDVLIIDESHNIKNPDAQITENIHAVAHLFAHKILLSGTAIKNKKSELYTQIELVAPGLFESIHHLKNATIGGTWNKIQSCYKTMAKHEVLKDLPEKLRSIVALDAKCPDLRADMDIGDISRLKNEVALAKASKTVEFVEEILEGSDSSVLVFSDSIEATREIAEKLGDQALLHHGQMSDDAREAAKKEFQNGGSKRVFVSTRQSLAVGATLTKADKVVFNDLPWTPADVRQAEDRAHRIGQTKMVNVYWAKAENNFWDSNIVEILYQKMDLSKKVLEGKQLTEAERKFIDEPIDVAEILARFKREKRKTEKKNKKIKTLELQSFSGGA